jgi:excisionase family DNA binding protein
MDAGISRATMAESKMSTPLAYTVAEACAESRAGRTTLYKAIRAGQLRARKRGRRTIILASDLLSWLESMTLIVTVDHTSNGDRS